MRSAMLCARVFVSVAALYRNVNVCAHVGVIAEDRAEPSTA